ncbi:MAG: GTP cyclohydrolase II [Rhodospirillaceae bacterium]|nr:GTP cyclohydrolase II [Rhodospirillaceae bacterium]
MSRQLKATSLMATTQEDAAQLEAVDRAVAELRRGGAVVIFADDSKRGVLAYAAETIDTWPPRFFDKSVGAPRVVITGRRAAILGLTQPDVRAVALTSGEKLSLAHIRALTDPQAERERTLSAGFSAAAIARREPEDAAIVLTKIARLLPAVISAPLLANDSVGWALAENRIAVSVSAIAGYDASYASTLNPISEAHVPLTGAQNTRIISFRPKDGGAEHLAIVVGTPDVAKPVLTRLHSECLTGDLLGSLRCDCGDQLHGAIAAIAKEGSGVLLYLAQEGRGIGLVNKLRAYALQDQGFDTVDANEQLGFDDDERVYLPAVRMLRCLGIRSVRLLTNNPAKVGALVRHGVEVVERVVHSFPSNEHNWNYLQTKAKRSGHLL